MFINITRYFNQFRRHQKSMLWFGAALLILSISQLIFGLSKAAKSREFIDYFVYYQATQDFMAGQSPYQLPYPVSQVESLSYLYPPGSFLFLAPFAVLPYNLSQTVFSVFSFVSFVAVWAILIKPNRSQTKLALFLIMVAFLIQTFPFKFSMVLGKINSVALLATVLSVELMNRKKNKLSGFFIAVAGSLKIFPLGILPVLWLAKKKSIVGWAIFFSVLMNTYKLPLLFEYLQISFPSFLASRFGESFYDVSLMAFFHRIGLGSLISQKIAMLVSLFLFGWVLLKTVRFSQKQLSSKKLNMLIWISLSIFSISGLSSPVHYLIFAYPLIVLFINKSAIFFAVWALLALHFSDAAGIVAQFPILASYQTILIFLLIISSLSHLSSKTSVS